MENGRLIIHYYSFFISCSRWKMFLVSFKNIQGIPH